MKRITTALIAVFLLPALVFSGGIVTNTNQSAAWTRYFARYATTDIDGVYYNPAGLTKLSDGFHFSINNQFIFKTHTISNDFAYLANGPDYVGDVKVLLFPDIYGAYNFGRFSVSVGFNPVGGGGSVTYNTGLPSFEMMSGVQLLSFLNPEIPTSAYSVNTYLKGTSAYLGIQVGVSYEISDMLSVYGGARYVNAVNNYEGYLKDLMINPTDPLVNPGGSMVSAPLYFSELSDTTLYLADNVLYPAQDMAEALPPADPINPLFVPVLQAFGVDPTGMTNADAAAAFGTLGNEYTQTSLETGMAAQLTLDQEVEVKQTGSGFTPIIGVHFSPVDMIDIALKYEFKTKLQLTNQTTKDFIMDIDPETMAPITMFPDGAVTNADIPSMLSGGINIRPLPGLQISGSFEYYWDKNVNWDGLEKKIEKNYFTIYGSAEYNIGGVVLVSASYGYDKCGVGKNYQSDMNYCLSATSFGFGGALNITDKLRINAGYVMAFYKDDNVEIPNLYTTTYKEKTNMFAVGIDFSF